MKINASGYPTPPLRPNAAPQKPASQTSVSTEDVKISSASQAIQAEGSAPVNSARIQEIKNAIAQGQFTINPDAIAEGLIQTARDLISHQRQA